MSAPEMKQTSLAGVTNVLDDLLRLVTTANQLRAIGERFIRNADEIQALAAKLKAEGRTTLNAEEWAAVAGPATAARDRLAAALGEKPSEA